MNGRGSIHLRRVSSRLGLTVVRRFSLFPVLYDLQNQWAKNDLGVSLGILG
jgi:hypothetical protein